MKFIKIANKKIGPGFPPFIIAEAGVNHNGKLQLALKLVDAAADAKADAVKFQTFRAKNVATRYAEMAAYQKKNLDKTESQLEMIKKLELPEKFYPKIIEHCRKRNIMFLSAPHGGFQSVDLLRSLRVPAFKFGSGDLTNIPLLQYAARLQKPMILATGMATMKEIKEALAAVKKTGNQQIIVLHCTTNYPCPLDEVNLRAMQTMMKELPHPIGYSDHTLGIEVSVMAAALGACVIEKHFTLNRRMKGPDHIASVEPLELKKLVRQVKNTEVILGSPVKKPSPVEIANIKIARKSVVAVKLIKKGEKFTAKNLGVKRPGTGLAPKLLPRILGKIARRTIAPDSLIIKKDYV